MIFAYRLEQIFLLVTSAVLLLLLLTQALVLRFTARRKWVPVKAPLITIAVAAALQQLVVGLDPSSVFGILPLGIQHAIASMVTCTLLHGASVIVLSLVRSLYLMMNKPLPPAVPWFLWGDSIINHIFLFGVAIGEAVTLSGNNPDLNIDNKWLVCKDTSFMFWSIGMSAAMGYATVGINSAVSSFITTSEAGNAVLRPAAGRSTAEPASRGSSQAAANADVTSRAQAENEDRPSILSINHVPASGPTSPAILALPAPPAYVVPLSSAAARAEELRAAVRRLRILVGLLGSVICVAFAITWLHTASFIRGESVDSNMPVTDTSAYAFSRCLIPLTQTSGLTVITWWLWSSPRILLQSPSFWTTLRRGVDDVLPRFAKERERRDGPVSTIRPATINRAAIAPAAISPTAAAPPPRVASTPLPSPSAIPQTPLSSPPPLRERTSNAW